MATTVVQARVDKELKEEADKLYKSLGFDIPTVIRAVLKQSVKERHIPISISEKSPYTPEFLEKIEQARKEFSEGKTSSYKSIDDAFDKILGKNWND